MCWRCQICVHRGKHFVSDMDFFCRFIFCRIMPHKSESHLSKSIVTSLDSCQRPILTFMTHCHIMHSIWKYKKFILFITLAHYTEHMAKKEPKHIVFDFFSQSMLGDEPFSKLRGQLKWTSLKALF